MASLQEKKDLTKAFDNPIPGQSLTNKPGAAKWEQPPEMTNLSQVADFFWGRVTSPTVFRDLMRMLDAGVPINLIVEHLIMAGAMEGKYNLDMALMVTPVVTTQIVHLAKMAGADYQIHQKEDIGLDPAPLAKLFSKKTKAKVTEDTPADEDMGLLSKPQGMK